MSANVFPRELGVKLTCNGCGAVAQTAMCGIKRNRDWQSTQGWGKGSDPGSPQRDPQPARKTTYTRNGVEVSRAVPASAGSPGRPSNITHDLCPPLPEAGPRRARGPQGEAGRADQAARRQGEGA